MFLGFCVPSITLFGCFGVTFRSGRKCITVKKSRNPGKWPPSNAFLSRHPRISPPMSSTAEAPKNILIALVQGPLGTAWSTERSGWNAESKDSGEIESIWF